MKAFGIIFEGFTHTVVHVMLPAPDKGDQQQQNDHLEHLRLSALEVNHGMWHPAPMPGATSTSNIHVDEMLPNEICLVDSRVVMTSMFLCYH